MGAPDQLLFEYSVIRYVPRVDREEFINIGLIMMSKRNRWIKSQVLIDPSRLLSLFPACNVDALQNQCRLFERKDIPEPSLPIEEKYRWLTAVKSASIQVSPSHPGLLSLKDPEEDVIRLMETEFERLFNLLVK